MPLGIRLTKGAGLARSSRRAPASAQARILALSGALALTASAGTAAADASSLPPQLSYAYGESETPRAAAFGGALRALGNGTSAIFTNPSAMVETRVYHLQGLLQWSPDAERLVPGAVVVDSVTGRLAGAIAFTGGWIDMGEGGGLRRSFLDVRVGLAYPITERLFIGVAGRYAKISQDGTLGGRWLDDGPVSGGLRDSDDVEVKTNQAGEQVAVPTGRHSLVDEFTFDASLTAKPTDTLYIAVVGQNLTFPNHGLLPTTLGGGVGVGTEDFSIEVDGLADLHSYSDATFRIMAGGEYLAADHFPLRAGYRYDQGAGQHALSIGVGYVGTQFSIEASVRRALAADGPTTIVAGLAYHLESSGLTRATSDEP
ncbi:hypothetical protein [Sorangium sp. So ce131]|uniref:hypothetical protein n=1 Tax=Sorangium sp. So ce131 TaxID=3133282 RepID=UPI003F61B048